MRRAPDERGCYVVWDLSEGSYDRHLERLRTERSANDPAPLTPEGLREVLAAVTLGDEDERRVADHELHLHDVDPWPDAEHDVA